MDVFTRRRIAHRLQIFPLLSFAAAFSFERGSRGEPEMSLFGKPFLNFAPHPRCIRPRRRVPPSAWVSLTPRLFARIDSGWGEARKSVFIQELRRTEMGRDWNRTIFNRSARFSAHSAPNEPPPPPSLLHIANRIRSLPISLVIPPAWHLTSYRELRWMRCRDLFWATNREKFLDLVSRSIATVRIVCIFISLFFSFLSFEDVKLFLMLHMYCIINPLTSHNKSD